MEAIQDDQHRVNYYTVHIALNFITPLGLKKFVAQSMEEYFKAKFEDRMQLKIPLQKSFYANLKY